MDFERLALRRADLIGFGRRIGYYVLCFQFSEDEFLICVCSLPCNVERMIANLGCSFDSSAFLNGSDMRFWHGLKYWRFVAIVEASFDRTTWYWDVGSRFFNWKI